MVTLKKIHGALKHTGIAKALENLKNITDIYIYRTTHLTVRDYISHETWHAYKHTQYSQVLKYWYHKVYNIFNNHKVITKNYIIYVLHIFGKV